MKFYFNLSSRREPPTLSKILSNFILTMFRLSPIWILLAILCTIGLESQVITAQNSGFVKTYFFENRPTKFYVARNYEDDVLVAGPVGLDTFGNTGVVLARIDSTGFVKKLFLFYDPGKTYNLYLFDLLYKGLTVSNNGDVILAGSTTRIHDLFQIIIKNGLEDISYHLYESLLPDDRYINNNLAFDSAIYTVGHAQDYTGSYEAFIQKSSLNGIQIWEKQYGTAAHFDYATSILPYGNNLLVLGNIKGDNNADPNTASTVTTLFVIDTSGKILSTWLSSINEEGVSAEGLLSIGDKYYYITHPFIVDEIGLAHFFPQIVCRDADFNLVWRKDYGEPYFQNHFDGLAKGPDGYLYAAGYIPVEGITWGRVCKIDPEDGEIIWEVRDTAFVVPGWGSRNRMEGIAVLSSGSIIAAGYTVDTNFREHGLLYKVTSDGCLDTLCTTVAIEELINNPDERVVVFPNPATEFINFNLPEAIKDCFVNLYTLDGQIISREKLSPGISTFTLDKSRYMAGIYIWQVTSDKGQLIDSGKVVIIDK